VGKEDVLILGCEPPEVKLISTVSLDSQKVRIIRQCIASLWVIFNDTSPPFSHDQQPILILKYLEFSAIKLSFRDTTAE